MTDWQLQQLTQGTDEGRFHTHSYYDINVFDSTSRYVAAHCVAFAERQPTADDSVEVGVIDLDDDARWIPVGTSHAWSWQQGPMAQWVPGRTTLIWNDRDDDTFVTRVHDLASGTTRTLGRPSYAVDPNGRFTLSLNMARLQAVRPGYGYAGGRGARLSQRAPRGDGVWRQSLDDGGDTLVLSVRRAVRFLMSRIGWRAYLRHTRSRYRYWFNHVKLSPDGRRFTVKLRFRTRGGGWNDRMGVSLTCNVDGSDLRLLASATSHVIWLDNRSLYFWQRDGFYLYADEAPEGRRIRQIAPEALGANAHVRYFPGSTRRFVFDTPYAEEIDLCVYDESDASARRIARFGNHRPSRGPFRCDLHPCPSPDGRRIVVTSLNDGGRQLYLLHGSD
ncbi:hypothetical protein [Salinisphaera orenii]|uniref:Uncharacterized protein n=1 Tax=Salinisphaera orenii YIM 95161 TaxID=1051139 RepID=A0A423PU75_9GAMM|nr:hypothetical protein [Salinisphaera halophila]ROO29165.1 hypothetical protein SAHL_09420 [Salinisphaera halophila YIM 95161]